MDIEQYCKQECDNNGVNYQEMDKTVDVDKLKNMDLEDMGYHEVSLYRFSILS